MGDYRGPVASQRVQPYSLHRAAIDWTAEITEDLSVELTENDEAKAHLLMVQQ